MWDKGDWFMPRLEIDGIPVEVDGVEYRVDVFLDWWERTLRALENVS